MKKRFVFLISLLLVINIGGVFAGLVIDDENLEIYYKVGENIEGGILTNITNQLASSIISSNLDNEISLIELLKKNNLHEVGDYNCSIKGCISDYDAGNEMASFELNPLDLPVIGFEISAIEPVEIISLEFSIETDATPECRPNFFVDALDNKENYFANYNSSGLICGTETQGCFDKNLAESKYVSAEVESAGFCEKVILPSSPAYSVGARIKNTEGNDYSLKMKLYDTSWNYLKECKLPEPAQSTNYEKISCRMNYSSLEGGEHYLCVSSVSNSGYKIKTETSGEICGITGASTQFSRDYDIFASAYQYGNVDIVVDEDNFLDLTGESLSSLADEYIEKRYGRNCTNGCVIPFKFYGDSQQVDLSNIELKYGVGGVILISNSLFELEKQDVLINGKSLSIDLKYCNFVILTNETNKFILYLDNTKILEKNINVSEGEREEFDVVPIFAYIGVRTEFTAIAENISSSEWNFGDGTIESSDSNKASHTYAEEGEYSLEIELKTLDGANLSKSLVIVVGKPQESAQRLITNFEQRVDYLPNIIDSFESFIKIELRKSINISLMNNSLQTIKAEFDSAVNDSDYEKIINDLLILDVPSNITLSETKTLPASVGFSNIDAGYIMDVGTGSEDVEDVSKLEDNIISWLRQNYEVNVEQEFVSEYGELGKHDLLTKFKIKINPKETIQENVYLAMSYPLQGIIFKEDYSAQESGSGTVIPITASRDIEFIIPEKIEISELGIYLSPEDLSQFKTASVEPFRERYPWGWFLLVLFLLIIIFLVTYIILQEWYKRYYEGHLFKDKAYLNSLMKYISNSRKSGMSDDEIKKKLRKSGWTREQIRYAFRKLDGKRTGMFEIPVFKFFERKKVREELAKGPQPSPERPPQQPAWMKQQTGKTGEHKIY